MNEELRKSLELITFLVTVNTGVSLALILIKIFEVWQDKRSMKILDRMQREEYDKLRSQGIPMQKRGPIQ